MARRHQMCGHGPAHPTQTDEPDHCQLLSSASHTQVVAERRPGMCRRDADPGPPGVHLDGVDQRARPAAHHRDPVGQGYRLVDVVSHEQDRARVELPVGLELLMQLPPIDCVEMGEGLVEEQDLGVVGDAPTQPGHGLLPQGERVRPLRPHPAQTHASGVEVANLLIDLLGLLTELGADGDISLHRPPWQQTRVLEHERGLLLVSLLADELDPTRRGLLQTGHDPKQACSCHNRWARPRRGRCPTSPRDRDRTRTRVGMSPP